ncbi:MAG: hypothetical protein BZY81_02145 [SAR202 cluster bacterium Io17-Chloro-G4]|nr:MAG: hypothetical protein BZY81_02145 [SAR202 cluster bacterium Io17-Chloro-G4]
MVSSIGPQYGPDDHFKAAARLHQSAYRAKVLKVDFDKYGNRLTESAGRALLNYYDGLGVREALRQRYPTYSKSRDADMLRSEHIPFNLFAPLIDRPELTKRLMYRILGVELLSPYQIKLEWAPKPAEKYLGDRTSFDTYIKGMDDRGRVVGVGIEVKYTEQGYRLGPSEALRVKNPGSTYWTTTRESGVFTNSGCKLLATDDLRQIWRNHLLGLKMRAVGDLDRFISVTIFPSGNGHMSDALSRYQGLLADEGKSDLQGCTFERYIDFLQGGADIEEWKAFLQDRYLVKGPV